MWQTHFGLRERIFSPAFDHQLPLLPTQQLARRQLLDALDAGHAIVLLVGEAGTGKTRLALSLAAELRAERLLVWMPPGIPGDLASFYQSLLFDLGLPWEVNEPTDSALLVNTLRLRLVEEIMGQQQAGKKILILADSVHDWPDTVLAEWGQLVTLTAGQPGSLQVVLVTCPDLLPRLEREPLLTWAQTIGYCVWLEPLDPVTTRNHLQQLANRVGIPWARLFDDEATDLLIRGSAGIIRRLHQAAARALTLAFLENQKQVNAELALAALEELGLAEHALAIPESHSSSSAA